MAHGAPDASNVVSIGQDFRLDDMAELAARLGSIMLYRRSGDVYFWDDFSEGVGRWTKLTAIAGSAVSLEYDHFLSGGASVRCDTAADDRAMAGVLKNFPPTATGRIALACGIDMGTNVRGFALSWDHYIEPIDYYAELWWDVLTGVLKVSPFLGVWETVTTIDHFPPGLDLFAQLKLVVDYDTNEYVSVAVNEAVYDLSGLPLREIDTVLSNYYEARIWFMGLDAGAYSGYIDHIVLTRNER